MKRRINNSVSEGFGGVNDNDDDDGNEDLISLERPTKKSKKEAQPEKAKKIVTVMKHPPNKVGGSVKKQEIYVSRKSNFQALYQRALRLLNDDSQGEGMGTVTLHGLGASIEKCVELALKIKEAQHAVLETTTSSEELVDELTPATEDDLPSWSVRVNSAIHIKISNRKLVKK